jgi:hypothetical protein
MADGRTATLKEHAKFSDDAQTLRHQKAPYEAVPIVVIVLP